MYSCPNDGDDRSPALAMCVALIADVEDVQLSMKIDNRLVATLVTDAAAPPTIDTYLSELLLWARQGAILNVKYRGSLSTSS